MRLEQAVPFVEWPKIHRLSRSALVTEKIDGTNSQVHIVERALMPDGFTVAGEGDEFFCVGPHLVIPGSRNRHISLKQDNFGFARWVKEHADELVQLGPGRHFGEWWGHGIQRGYGLKEKRFSLFNALRWKPVNDAFPMSNEVEAQRLLVPACCHVVPVLAHGVFSTPMVDTCLMDLELNGSYAAPGFKKPEGIVIYHEAGNVGFKKTLDKNDGHKGV